jgi:HSP20 family protein
MWAEACALLDQAERRHRHFFELLGASAARPVWEPPADIFSVGTELHVIVALPGARHDEVSVQLTASGLQVDAVVPPPAVGAGSEVIRLEIPYGRMRRSVSLPPGGYALVERRLERGYLLLRLARSSS